MTSPDDPPDKRSLTAHCREQLARYKVPREFQIVPHLDRTPTGKVRRGASTGDVPSGQSQRGMRRE